MQRWFFPHPRNAFSVSSASQMGQPIPDDQQRADAETFAISSITTQKEVMSPLPPYSSAENEKTCLPASARREELRQTDFQAQLNDSRGRFIWPLIISFFSPFH
jgi:hypothetical protein